LLFNLPPLAAEKLSGLLAKMISLCPRGQNNKAFFNKMSRKLRILLSEAAMGDKQEGTSSGPTTSSCPVKDAALRLTVADPVGRVQDG
jgi:hypothetical protein